MSSSVGFIRLSLAIRAKQYIAWFTKITRCTDQQFDKRYSNINFQISVFHSLAVVEHPIHRGIKVLWDEIITLICFQITQQLPLADLNGTK